MTDPSSGEDPDEPTSVDTGTQGSFQVGGSTSDFGDDDATPWELCQPIGFRSVEVEEASELDARVEASLDLLVGVHQSDLRWAPDPLDAPENADADTGRTTSVEVDIRLEQLRFWDEYPDDCVALSEGQAREGALRYLMSASIATEDGRLNAEVRLDMRGNRSASAPVELHGSGVPDLQSVSGSLPLAWQDAPHHAVLHVFIELDDQQGFRMTVSPEGYYQQGDVWERLGPSGYASPEVGSSDSGNSAFEVPASADRSGTLDTYVPNERSWNVRVRAGCPDDLRVPLEVDARTAAQTENFETPQVLSGFSPGTELELSARRPADCESAFLALDCLGATLGWARCETEDCSLEVSTEVTPDGCLGRVAR